MLFLMDFRQAMRFEKWHYNAVFGGFHILQEGLKISKFEKIVYQTCTGLPDFI